MPTLFDQYKSMDRGLTKKFAAGGGKETIRLTLLEAARNDRSKAATMLLIRDLLYIKAAQARDKGNTELLGRMHASLPTRIALVNNLRPERIVHSNMTTTELEDLDTFKLQQFIANSSSVFQRQIPDTFRRLLVELLGPDFSNVKNYLVDSYTAYFLCNNKLISEGDVRNAGIVPAGERKRPNASQMKAFIVQILNINQFDKSALAHKALEFCKIPTQVVVDMARFIDPKSKDSFGLSKDKKWLLHVFKCHEFILEAISRGKLDGARGMTTIGGYPVVSSAFASIKPQINSDYAKPGWLVYFSLQQYFFLISGRLPNIFYHHWLDTKDNKKDPACDNLQCDLPGGWADYRHIYMFCRYQTPTCYDVIRQSVKYSFVYQLFWVVNPVERRNETDLESNPENIPFGSNGQSSSFCWVILTVNCRLSFPPITLDAIPTHIRFEGIDNNYEVEVFDSKPEYPKIKWPNLFS